MNDNRGIMQSGSGVAPRGSGRSMTTFDTNNVARYRAYAPGITPAQQNDIGNFSMGQKPTANIGAMDEGVQDEYWKARQPQNGINVDLFNSLMRYNQPSGNELFMPSNVPRDR